MSKEAALTASNIRYLLAINELESSSGGVRGSEIARLLGVTRPSAHMMIKKLCAKGYATKEKHAAVRLTALGKRLAAAYSAQYALLYSRMERSLRLSPEGCRDAVYAILAQGGSDESAQPEEQEA